MTLHDRPLGELGYPPFELAADENVDSHRWFDGKVSLFYLLTSLPKSKNKTHGRYMLEPRGNAY